MTTYELEVEGMSCEGCVKSITNALKELDSNLQISVSLKSKSVCIQTTSEKQSIVNVIEDAGFSVTFIKTKS